MFNTYLNKKKVFHLFTIFLNFWSLNANHDIFHQDLSDQMKIGLSDTGYKSVKLKCGSNSFNVEIATEHGFEGVIYTRGSFYEKNSPCFYDPQNQVGHTFTHFQIKIPFENCKTDQEANKYSNVLVLQHDKELIMPGDAAFTLECDFSNPKDVIVKTNIISENKVVSRIILSDADPLVKKTNKTPRVESQTNSVILKRNKFKMLKEEL